MCNTTSILPYYLAALKNTTSNKQYVKKKDPIKTTDTVNDYGHEDYNNDNYEDSTYRTTQTSRVTTSSAQKNRPVTKSLLNISIVSVMIAIITSL